MGCGKSKSSNSSKYQFQQAHTIQINVQHNSNKKSSNDQQQQQQQQAQQNIQEEEKKDDVIKFDQDDDEQEEEKEEQCFTIPKLPSIEKEIFNEEFKKELIKKKNAFGLKQKAQQRKFRDKDIQFYDPDDYKNLNVSEDIKNAFFLITNYIPKNIEIENKFQPIKPDYEPVITVPFEGLNVLPQNQLEPLIKDMGIKELDNEQKYYLTGLLEQAVQLQDDIEEEIEIESQLEEEEKNEVVDLVGEKIIKPKRIFTSEQKEFNFEDKEYLSQEQEQFFENIKYEPENYADMNVSDEIKDLFRFITKYEPEIQPIFYKQRPFIPDYGPETLGLYDGLNVELPSKEIPQEYNEQYLGLKVLDEVQNIGVCPNLEDLSQEDLNNQVKKLKNFDFQNNYDYENEEEEKQDNGEKDDKHQCKICYDKEANFIAINCMHVVACKDCAPLLKEQCPICRTKGQIKKIFF